MEAVTNKKKSVPNANNSAAGATSQSDMIRFESLDHFAVEQIDLEYNKLSYLVLQTVDKLVKNLNNFKEQAKFHENMLQMQS